MSGRFSFGIGLRGLRTDRAASGRARSADELRSRAFASDDDVDVQAAVVLACVVVSGGLLVAVGVPALLLAPPALAFLLLAPAVDLAIDLRHRGGGGDRRNVGGRRDNRVDR